MADDRESNVLARREFLLAGAAGSFLARGALRAAEPAETYETHAKGVRIVPGQWRPHYPWEHIAWVSPSWPSQDYVWLDFPEAIFTRRGLLYLSHVNPQFPAAFPDLPAVAWRRIPGGIAYERRLPNGVAFSGKIVASKEGADLELEIANRSDAPLREIRLQTCVFLRAIREFSARTAANKLVHAPGRGWIPILEALRADREDGTTRIGWR
ncbi:MAG: hypothetical protein JXP34_13900, partial [Planctomycetes bacterium]|nr:hypothetical protein [Planctomycetota bacterium]